MLEQTSVGQVYGKKMNEEENLKLVNSFRYHNAPRTNIKDWSPEIHRHELITRQRKREEVYIGSTENIEKPALLIQKKEIFKHLPLSKSMSPISNNEVYFKITSETKMVQSISHEILKGKEKEVEQLIKKIKSQKTKNSKSVDGKNRKSINKIENRFKQIKGSELEFYKIQGIEFLPEGFIELEPVLFHDEYRFATERDRLEFGREQRKNVTRRKKQYDQRANKKMRDVTLFVVKDFVKNLDDFFETWFAQNKRKMTIEEIEFAAQELDVKKEVVLHMQTEFLEKKKEKNSNTLNIFFQNRDFASMEKLNKLPRFLQEYFFNYQKEDYSHIKSKHLEVHQKSKLNSQLLSKKSSNLTFRTPDLNFLGKTSKSDRYFEKINHEGMKVEEWKDANKTVTLNEILDGTSNLKIKDFEPEWVAGSFKREEIKSEKTKGKTLECLNELLNQFQREKYSHTKNIDRGLKDTCEVKIEKNFDLMNCKGVMESPVENNTKNINIRRFIKKLES